jgi:hypothetical protein
MGPSPLSVRGFIGSACRLLLADFLLDLLFDPEDGRHTFLRIVGKLLQKCKALQPRRLNSSILKTERLRTKHSVPELVTWISSSSRVQDTSILIMVLLGLIPVEWPICHKLWVNRETLLLMRRVMRKRVNRRCYFHGLIVTRGLCSWADMLNRKINDYIGFGCLKWSNIWIRQKVYLNILK